MSETNCSVAPKYEKMTLGQKSGDLWSRNAQRKNVGRVIDNKGILSLSLRSSVSIFWFDHRRPRWNMNALSVSLYCFFSYRDVDLHLFSSNCTLCAEHTLINIQCSSPVSTIEHPRERISVVHLYFPLKECSASSLPPLVHTSRLLHHKLKK